MAAEYDLTQALEGQKLSGFLLRLIAVSWLVTFFDAYDMQVISFASKALQSAFHLNSPQLGWLFSIGVIGTIVGGFLFGWIGDRVGRRPTIIVSTGLFAALTAAMAFAQSDLQLYVLRFLDGVALGGAMPLIWALNVEYAPKRLRATVITLIMLGYGVGAMAAGPIARLILPRFDWPGIFIAGGLMSLAATLLLLWALPESLRFLVGKAGSGEQVSKILGRMRLTAPSDLSFVLTDENVRTGERFRVSMLFRGELRWLTPLLWLSYFASSISTFFVSFWGPRILEDLGFSADHAAWVTAMNSAFSMTGGLLLMRFTDRHGPVSIAVLPLTAVPLLLVMGLAPIGLTGFLFMLIPIAIFLGGSHYGVTSIVSAFYPSPIRANGTGWCSGVAKIGSALGPTVGGYVLATHIPVRMTYALLAICPLVYGLAVLAIGLIVRKRRLGAEAAAALAAAE